jgi:hypothetical protein
MQSKKSKIVLFKVLANVVPVSLVLMILIVCYTSEKAIAQITPYPYPYPYYPYPPYNYNYNYYYNSPIITGSYAYTDNLGRIHIVGQVTNYSPDIAQYVQVRVNLYDMNNNIIFTHPSVTNPQDIFPGQQANFDTIISSNELPNPQQVRYYTVVVPFYGIELDRPSNNSFVDHGII